MANEFRMIPNGKQVTLRELLPGTMFYYDGNAYDCIAVKSEYACKNGLIEAYIIDSGELFWGGAKTVAEQHELMVQPLEIVDVDAVEVVRCKDCHYWNPRYETMGMCMKHNSIVTFTKPDFYCAWGREEKRWDLQERLKERMQPKFLGVAK